MGIFSGFPFQTKAQMQAEQDAFEKRVFPFGVDAAREKARVLLAPYATKKVGERELLFAYISSKDAYALDGGGDEGLAAAKRALKRQNWLPADAVSAILALVHLEEGRTSIDEFPTAEELRVALVIDDDVK